MSASKTHDEAAGFEHLARELGCDPNDPRVAEVLKTMAAQPPKPHEKSSGDRPPARNKKRSAAKAT